MAYRVVSLFTDKLERYRTETQRRRDRREREKKRQRVARELAAGSVEGGLRATSVERLQERERASTERRKQVESPTRSVEFAAPRPHVFSSPSSVKVHRARRLAERIPESPLSPGGDFSSPLFPISETGDFLLVGPSPTPSLLDCWSSSSDEEGDEGEDVHPGQAGEGQAVFAEGCRINLSHLSPWRRALYKLHHYHWAQGASEGRPISLVQVSGVICRGGTHRDKATQTARGGGQLPQRPTPVIPVDELPRDPRIQESGGQSTPSARSGGARERREAQHSQAETGVDCKAYQGVEEAAAKEEGCHSEERGGCHSQEDEGSSIPTVCLLGSREDGEVHKE